ncbi:hypothetical protein X798_07020 [Onchocerca flexuosa]|uniref:Uncharacterized protein n=1 Tax=Onchocerca flexuosa TaxID=387005 RepID=A0A238BN80_9BILA|nr:hypothetical protein X798_07020 [Onchocerca flexuosa]
MMDDDKTIELLRKNVKKRNFVYNMKHDEKKNVNEWSKNCEVYVKSKKDADVNVNKKKKN